MLKISLNLNQNIDTTKIGSYNTSFVPAQGLACDKFVSFKSNQEKHDLSHYRGCLVGGAVGDALGWPVEFSELDTIKARFGKNGITEMKLDKRNKAQITDDTQMTIFTADGLLKSAVNALGENELPDMSEVFHSYQNWLQTQDYGVPKIVKNEGWLSTVKELYNRRAPGNTCTGSIEEGRPGSIERPRNDSKGCGGVMRVAPAGLIYYKNPKTAFEVGASCAALTHGSPAAYLSAGVHSTIIANIVKGEKLEDAVDSAMEILKTYENSEKLFAGLSFAKISAKSDVSPEEIIPILGGGWHGDEAIAISVYCALKYQDNFEKAIIAAVNHSGDSDSTGAITGNILGAYLGEKAIPKRWTKNLELYPVLNQLSKDLVKNPQEIIKVEKKYPSAAKKKFLIMG